MTPEDPSEIKDLLKEIRDFHKAHYERYVAFTDEIMRNDKQARESAKQSEKEHEAFLQHQLAYQEEMREAVHSSQRNTLIGLFAVLGFLLIMVIGYVFLNSLNIQVGPEP